MATLENINIGATPDDGTGDPLRTAIQKLISNDEAINEETEANTAALNAAVAFSATGMTAQTIPYSDSADTKVTMLTNVEFNHGNGYNAASNQFTAPVAGVYDISAALYIAGVSGSLVAAPWALLTLYKNGASFKSAYFFQAFRSDGHGLITGNWKVGLAQGDTLTLYLRQVVISSGVTIRANTATQFAGALIR